MGGKTVKKQAQPCRFLCQASEAREVYLVGTFNDWKPDATPMKRIGDGEWAVSLRLAPGRYEYKFIVDGSWCCEPSHPDTIHECPESVINEHGTMNRVIVILPKAGNA